MNCELFNMDVMDGLREIKDETVDVVVTSPPYNLGKKYRSSTDKMKREDYLSWTTCWCKEAERILKPGGSFFLNMGSYSKWPTQSHDVIHMLTRVHHLFHLQNTFHWIKAITVGDKSHGHFTPVSSPRYVNKLHEYVFHLTKSGAVRLDRLALGVPYEDKSNINRWGHTQGADLRCRGDVWFIPYKTIQSRDKHRPHPATFPPELATNCILVHHGDNLIVADPFVGVGNSGVGAFRSGKVTQFYGVDLDDFYIDETAKKLEALCSHNTHSSPKTTKAS